MNIALLIGEIVREPRTRSVGEHRVTEITVKTTGVSKSGKTYYDYVPIEAWNVAEFQTGAVVLVEGSATTQDWTDKESGQKRYKTIVKAHRITPTASPVPTAPGDLPF